MSDNNVVPLKNSFREEQEAKEPKLSSSYTMEVQSETPGDPPTRKVFAVANAKITETLNVIRRLLTGPPPGTRLIAFTIFPHSFSANDVMEQAKVLAKSALASPFYNEINKEQPADPEVEEAPKEEAPVILDPIDEDPRDQHPVAGGMADADPQ